VDKSELLRGLRERNQQWLAVLDEVGPARMEQPGVIGDWSMKDLVAHLTVWNRRLVAGLHAAQRGEPEPGPPWSPDLQTEDEINAWIYESERRRPLPDLLAEMHRLFEQILAWAEDLPDDVKMARVEPSYYLVWMNDRRLLPGEFFDHFHDDHEPDVRAWLAREG
jgi:hypothetical protein